MHLLVLHVGILNMRVLFEAHTSTASYHHAMATTYRIIFSVVLICFVEEHVVPALAANLPVLLGLIHLLLLLVVLEGAHVPVPVLCHQAVIVYRHS